MSEQSQFDEMKDSILHDNEEQYGAEVREKYGSDVVDKANERFRQMSPDQYARAAQLSEEINETLAEAVRDGDPGSEVAQRCCALHKEWLTYFWPEGMYTPQAHLLLGEMYVSDERFKAYYDAIAPNGAEFLLEALRIFVAA